MGVPILRPIRKQSFPNVAKPSFATQASVCCDFSSLKNRRSSPSDYQNLESREISGSEALLRGKQLVCGVDEFRLFDHARSHEFSQNPRAINEAPIPGIRSSHKTQNLVVSGVSLNSLRYCYSNQLGLRDLF